MLHHSSTPVHYVTTQKTLQPVTREKSTVTLTLFPGGPGGPFSPGGPGEPCNRGQRQQIEDTQIFL